ncbi:MAG: L,D-transpeptidase [Lachnospiraceae bacterium]|nr:L,D-transpeptidase [Lachnospiraceae bacterium]
MKKLSRLQRRLLILNSLLFVLLAVMYFGISHYYKTHYLEGTSVNGFDVGNLTLEQAAEVLRPSVEDYHLTLTFRGGNTETVAGSDIDYTYTPGNEYAMILENQNPLLWIAGAIGQKEEYRTVTPVSYDREKLQKLLLSFPEMQAENVSAPTDAYMKLTSAETDGGASTASYEVVPETEGNQLIADNFVASAASAIEGKYSELDLETADSVYAEPAVRSDNETLTAAVAAANRFLAVAVTFTNNDGAALRTLDSSVTKDWLEADSETGYASVQSEALEAKIRQYVADWAAADDTYGNFRVFRSTNYGNIKMPTDALHGHALDQEGITAQLLQDLTSGEGAVSHTVTYSAYEDSKDPQFGGSYVEVDIDAQQIYVYQNYELMLSSNVVTGNEYSTRTPAGIYSIYYRERNAQLTGEMRSDGTPSYVAHVSYWMAYNGGYGLHDATWRGSFGGDIYTYDGSHGCTNLPLDVARQVWNLTDFGTPVILFRASALS